MMPSHVHAIIVFSNTGKTINNSISNGERFMTYEIVKKRAEQNQHLILQELSNSLNDSE